MVVIADTHVHLHGCHRTEDLLRTAFVNLGRLAGADQAASSRRVLCLAERQGRQAFRELRAGDQSLSGGGWLVTGTAEPEALLVADPEGHELMLVAGRQIATRERLEILALTVDLPLHDGLPIAETIDAVLDAGGVPVLAWAPGKWLFGRGHVVASMLRRYGPSRIAVGDTTLRPIGWPEPHLMAKARASGYSVLAGSDPLPFPGEEEKVASYGAFFTGGLDDRCPVTSLRGLLFNGVRSVGRRDRPFEVLRRLKRHAESKR